MKVYLIDINSQDFRQLEFIEKYDAHSRIPIMENQHPTDWQPPLCRYIEEEKPLADFLVLEENMIAFNFSEIDDNAEYPAFIRGLIDSAGGVAFFDVENASKHSVFFVTEACNALNRQSSDLVLDENGGINEIRNFVFHAGRIHTNSGLFRLGIPGIDSKYLFAYQDEKETSDEDMKFYDRYHQRGLTGLEFTLVWSDA